MRLRQLEYAVAVAETSSFTKAASRMHVAQPTLSYQIRALEEEVGSPLFHRPPGPVGPTPAGRLFLADARLALTAVHRALDSTRRANAIATREIRVATVRSLSSSLLPGCIQLWRARYPGTTVVLREYATRAEARQAILDGLADLGIGPHQAGWRGATRPIGWDRLVVVLPLTDPLAQLSGSLALESLADRDWVLFQPQVGLAERTRRTCAAAGFTPRAAVETSQIDAAARLAAAGVGPALLPAMNVPPNLAAVVRELEPSPTWEISAYVQAPDFSPTEEALVEVLIEADWPRQRPPHANVLRD